MRMHRLWVRSWVVLMVIVGCVAGLVSPAVAQDEEIETIDTLPGYVAGFSQLSWNTDAYSEENPAGSELMFVILIEFEDAESAEGGFDLVTTPDELSTAVEPREELGDAAAALVAGNDDDGTITYSLAVREDNVLFFVTVSAYDDSGEEVVYDVMKLMLSREPSDDPAEVNEEGEVSGSWAAVFPTVDDAEILKGLEPYPVFDPVAVEELQASTPAA
jgi:hypothetical protein